MSALKESMASKDPVENILIKTSDFNKAFLKVFPSVSKKDEQIYKKL